jgi:hypothetical protein
MSIRDLLRNQRIVTANLLTRIESCNFPLDSIKIDALNLSTRSYNALKRNGIDDIRKLVFITDTDLAKIPNIGFTSFQEIVTNTNEYLERIMRAPQNEQFLKISLDELLQAEESKVHFTVSTALPNLGLDKQHLEPIPIHEIIINNKGLLERLMHFGLSSSLDIWVLALGHHLNVAPVFTESLKEVSEAMTGKWRAGRPADFWTGLEVIIMPSTVDTALGVSGLPSHAQGSYHCLKVQLVIKPSPNSEVHWEAILPSECLTQKIDWVHHDDKTRAFCIFLKQSVQNNVAHWAYPVLANWESLPRSRAIDAFYDWIFSIKSRTFGRDFEIFKDWFGLTSGERKTLEEVGYKYSITRERVRQIVNRLIKLLLHPSRKKYLTPFTPYFDMLFEKHGGIMTLKEIVNSCSFFEEFVGVSPLQAAELLLVACNKYNPLNYYPFKDKLSNVELHWVTWYITEINPEDIIRTRETACQLIRNDPLRYHNDELVDLISSMTNIEKETVRASLRTCRDLKETGLGYSHLGNGERHLTTSQMAIVALRELLVPARCSVIYKKICEIFPNHNVDIGTLRNTLRSGQFRIIDRGIYGLSESKRR